MIRIIHLGLLALVVSGGAVRADEFALARAFAVYDAETLTHFVQTHANTDVPGYRYGRDQNVVHVALENRAHPWAVLLAFSMGADINHADGRGRTPLFRAIDANLPVAAMLLMELGADVTVPGTDGATVFDLCRLIRKDAPEHETCTMLAALRENAR